MQSNILGPTIQSVIERFSLLGEFVVRGSSVYSIPCDKTLLTDIPDESTCLIRNDPPPENPQCIKGEFRTEVT